MILIIRSLLIKYKDCDSTAIMGEKENISYKELTNNALAIQQYLLNKLSENHVVAVFLPNGSNYISAFFAVIMSGMIVFPLNESMTVHEIKPLLKYASVNTIITSHKYHMIFEEITNLAVIYVEDVYDKKLKYITEIKNICVDKPMVFLNTSGTTGKSKIVQLSEKNIETSMLGYMERMEFEKTTINNTKFILATPFSSAYGLMVLCTCLMKSFPIVVLDNLFTLDVFYRMIEKYKVTHYEGGSFPLQIMEQMLYKTNHYDISSLKSFGFGGSKVSGKTIGNVSKIYKGIDFLQGYGMTEAAPLITKHKCTEVKRYDSVGMAIKGVQIVIESNGEITDKPFIKGEILVKGSNIMIGYYKNEEETKKILKNGYLYTGDIGYLDEDGYLYIIGRKKNIIIVRGLNVYPEEVEECILNSLLVKECVVYGKIDNLGNEIVCADIIPVNNQINLDEIINYCNIHLTGYKHPKEFHICDTIQKNSTGKIERKMKVCKVEEFS